jgi:hypothetical protein
VLAAGLAATQFTAFATFEFVEIHSTQLQFRRLAPSVGHFGIDVPMPIVRESSAGLDLDRVVGLKVVLQRAGHDLDTDLGTAELDQPAVLEPVDDRAREELDLLDVRRHCPRF